MMRRHFRRRRRASWTYSNSEELSITSASPTLGSIQYDSSWLYPPARAQFIMDTRTSSRLTFAGCHLWLDFAWRCTANSPLSMPDVNFCIYKTQSAAGSTAPDPDATLAEAQWTTPATPATITSWEENDDDGTESYLWQHWMRGNGPPNSIIWQSGGAPSGATQVINNQGNLIDGKGVDNVTQVCRKFQVTQEWQPDVTVRAKRRLNKGEGIAIFMWVAGTVASGMQVACPMRWRCLTS